MAMTWDGAAVEAYLRDRAREKITKVAELLLEYAQEECPVDTGALKQSGRIEYDDDGLSARVIFTGDEERNYAYYVEFGTIRWKQPPNPFLRRALARAEPEARAIFGSP